jgi:hypothetical protein
MYFVPEGQHDRSLAQSAWDSATPKDPSRGYGMIRAGVRTDSKIGGGKSRMRYRLAESKWSLNPFQEEYLAFLKNRDAYFDEKYLWDQLRPIIPYPTGRFFGETLSQALRARLRSCCPSGTKAIHPSKGPALS